LGHLAGGFQLRITVMGLSPDGRQLFFISKPSGRPSQAGLKASATPAQSGWSEGQRYIGPVGLV